MSGVYMIADDYDSYVDDPDSEGKCSVVIALMQEHRRSQRYLGVKTLQIGFIIYKVCVSHHVNSASLMYKVCVVLSA